MGACIRIHVYIRTHVHTQFLNLYYVKRVMFKIKLQTSSDHNSPPLKT